MAAIRFNKVNALPGTLDANSVYFVVNGGYAETYVTDSAGVAKSVGNTSMIAAIATAQINTALADLNMVDIVANIAARNALVVGKQRNMLILVQDATGDATVATGAALYSWNETGGVFVKLTEYEGLDVSLVWSNISGRPGSSPASIDDAVNKRHAHANTTQLDKIGEDVGGNLTFNGQPVAASWTTNNW